ncbi:MAG: hypothetical protein ACKO28_02475 [Cyanobium sp.]
MNSDIRRRGRPAWLFHQLNQGRFILRLFLIGLLLLLFLGFAGALQSGLSPIGAGQTELVYSIASLRNGASLTPIEEETRFSNFTTADAELQHYFSLDPETGTLILRDGLRSLSIQSNPLGSFPYQIIETNPGRSTAKVVSLYVQLLDCEAFLAQVPRANGIPALNQPPVSMADRVLSCMQIQPVLVRRASLREISTWIQHHSENLLPTQRAAYLTEAQTILSLPQNLSGDQVRSFQWWDQGPHRDDTGESPVLRIFVLKDKALPGLPIFQVRDATQPPSPPPPLAKGSPAESLRGGVLRQLDRLFLLILQLRYPVLISIGILLPLFALIIRQRDVVVRRCLEPYLLLLIAQVFTMLLGDALMGEGLVIWIGFLYTVLRLLQLLGLFWMGSRADRHVRRLFDLRSRTWLRRLLWLEFVLWSINAIGLGWHIAKVMLLDFSFISPA